MSQEWMYKPKGQRKAQALYTFSGAALMVAGMAAVMQPAVLGGVLIYGAMTTALSFGGLIPFVRRRSLNKWVAEGKLQRVKGGTLLETYNSIEQAIDMKPTQGLYIADMDFIAQAYLSSLSVAERFAFKLKNIVMAGRKSKTWIDDMRMKEASKGVFFALTQMNIVGTTQEALHANDKDHVHFCLAHELTHIKNRDSRDIVHAGAVFCKETLGLLKVFKWGLPVLLYINPLGALALVSCAVAGNLAIKKSSRIKEELADRGAMYVTRDKKASYGLCENRGRFPSLTQIFSTHPVGDYRRENANLAYEEVQKFPPMKADFVKACGDIEQPENRANNIQSSWLLPTDIYGNNANIKRVEYTLE